MFSSFIRIVTFCLCTQLAVTAWGGEATPPPAPHAAAQVSVFNRPVVVFRAPFLGVPAEERAQRTEEVLQRVLEGSKQGIVSSQPIAMGRAIMVDGSLAFVMVPEDARPQQHFGPGALRLWPPCEPRRLGVKLHIFRLVAQSLSPVRSMPTCPRYDGTTNHRARGGGGELILQ